MEAEAENRLLSAQVQQLQAESDDLRKRLEISQSQYMQSSSEIKRQQQMLDFQAQQLATASRQITEIGAANVRLNSLADIGKRCEPYKTDVDDLQKELAGRSFFGPPQAERKAELAVLIQQASERLTTCITAGK